MRILAAIVLSIGIFSAGYYWQKSHQEVVELSLDIGFRAIQRLAYDEELLSKSLAHDFETVSANLTMKGRQTPVFLRALPQYKKMNFSAVRVTVDEKDDYEPRNMLLINKEVIKDSGLSDLVQKFLIQEAPLYVNGKRLADYILIAEPFYSLVTQGSGPFVRRISGNVSLSYQSQLLPIMDEILREKGAKLPDSDEKYWWYWNKKEWVLFGEWPHGWPL